MFTRTRVWSSAQAAGETWLPGWALFPDLVTRLGPVPRPGYQVQTGPPLGCVELREEVFWAVCSSGRRSSGASGCKTELPLGD